VEARHRSHQPGNRCASSSALETAGGRGWNSRNDRLRVVDHVARRDRGASTARVAVSIGHRSRCG